MQTPPASPYFAAVDLGSNSFHLIVARIQDGRLDVVDREKEMVQIARGMLQDGRLSVAAQTRALDCLHRFSERLRDIPPDQIRAVGTKTLRSASKSRAFLKRAQQALGVPIQIISGFEEARLVYAGLANSVLNDHNRRLVVDIGGGSTECIIGQDYDPIKLASLSMGCVSFTEAHLGKSGKVTRKFMKKSYLAACSEIEVLRADFLKTGWNMIYGTSGTVRAIADLTMNRNGGAVITKDSLNLLAEAIISDEKALANVPRPRQSVLPAGVAILQAVFDQLNIEVMHVADAALKEGLLYDTIGRLSNRDPRNKTILKLQEQYQADPVQAQRVAGAADHFWQQIPGPPLAGVSRTKILRWAALLHEIGMSISHSSYHDHGYYILKNTDMAGFGRYEQYILANLVKSHRKRLNQKRFEDLDETALAAFIPLLLCLRLAALLHRRREDLRVLPSLKVDEQTYRLKFPPDWLKEHPLTLAGLKQEQDYLRKIDVALEFK